MLASLDVASFHKPYARYAASEGARVRRLALTEACAASTTTAACSPNRRHARLPPHAAVSRGSRERPRKPRRPTARRQHGAQKRRKLEPLRLAAFCVSAGALPLLDLARRAC